MCERDNAVKDKCVPTSDAKVDCFKGRDASPRFMLGKALEQRIRGTTFTAKAARRDFMRSIS